MQVTENIRERKRVLIAEREQQAFFGCRRLQLEIELAAETLPQRERPGAVDAAAKRRVQYELHAAGIVEEALEDDRVLRRQRAENRQRRGKVIDHLRRGLARYRRFFDQ